MKNRWRPYWWGLYVIGIMVGMCAHGSFMRRERQNKYAEMVEQERRSWRAQLEEMRRSRTEKLAVSESFVTNRQVESSGRSGPTGPAGHKEVIRDKVIRDRSTF
jgi:hypothetical protein